MAPVRYLRTCASIFLIQFVLYTGFGYVLVARHADQLAAEMALVQASGLPALIAPTDHFLTSFSARLGSAVLFGLTIGALAGLLMCLWAYPFWRRGFGRRRDQLWGVIFAALLAWLTFTAEIAWLSSLWALAGLGLSYVIIRLGRQPQDHTRPDRRLSAVMLVLVLLPLALLLTASYVTIRDSLLAKPVLAGLNRFYYEHTLLAADVIKPAASRTQVVMAVAGAPARVVSRVPGCLMILTDSPDRAAQARIRLDYQQQPGSSALDQNAALQSYSAKYDASRRLRLGVGLGLVCLKLVGLGLAVWFGFALAGIYAGNRATCLVLAIVYYAFFSPLAQLKFYEVELKRVPNALAAFARSDCEAKRYLAASSPLLECGDLARLAGDQSPRVRLTALVNAGERRELSLLPQVLQALNDPQLNVRTKACWALGRMPDRSAIGALYARLQCDPSWYVRDYAYAALNQIQPISRIVRLQ